MSDLAKAFQNQSAAMAAIPPELLPDYIEAHPEKAKVLVQNTTRIAEIAAQLGQWDALAQAIKFLMAAQQAVSDWWTNNVHPPGRKLSRVPGKVSPAEAQRVIGFSDTVLSRWRHSLLDPGKYEEQLLAAARRKAGLDPEPNRVAPNSGEFEWYTPAEYIAAARHVMGSIDLDPASSDLAQETVQATQHFTAADNGLTQEWHGSVWLNPPYSAPLIDQFIDKLGEELAAGHVDQAIMVTNNCTDTAWFHAAVTRASLLCFTRGRIRFANPNKPAGESPLQGQCFFYHGPEVQAFAATFSAFGFIAEPWRQP